MHSSKFVTGFCIFVFLLVFIFVYPLFNPGNALEMVGVGNYAEPGTYINLYDAVDTDTRTFKLSDAEDNRINKLMSDEDCVSMIEYLTTIGVDVSGINIEDDGKDELVDLWNANFDSSAKPKGMTNALWRNLKNLNTRIQKLANGDTYTVTLPSGSEEEEDTVVTTITNTAYVNVKDVVNSITLPLGTDNFGRDVLKELVAATKTSLLVGLIAGTVATLIGLLLGLLSGYLGGWVDDVIMFITNVFTVIPSFVLLILISYSLGQEQRGVGVVAMVIGFTSWAWTTRSVRSQVISLRNRDHVNLSKLSGHSLFRIIFTDILPYIASYVVMAFVLQVSSGILSEAQLSMLGLGPKTTTTPTLGLMMNWATKFNAQISGYWWGYLPVILTIALISFSLNLMNTGMDQVFNPQLRD